MGTPTSSSLRARGGADVRSVDPGRRAGRGGLAGGRSGGPRPHPESKRSVATVSLVALGSASCLRSTPACLASASAAKGGLRSQYVSSAPGGAAAAAAGAIAPGCWGAGRGGAGRGGSNRFAQCSEWGRAGRRRGALGRVGRRSGHRPGLVTPRAAAVAGHSGRRGQADGACMRAHAAQWVRRRARPAAVGPGQGAARTERAPRGGTGGRAARHATRAARAAAPGRGGASAAPLRQLQVHEKQRPTPACPRMRSAGALPAASERSRSQPGAGPARELSAAGALSGRPAGRRQRARRAQRMAAAPAAGPGGPAGPGGDDGGRDGGGEAAWGAPAREQGLGGPPPRGHARPRPRTPPTRPTPAPPHAARFGPQAARRRRPRPPQARPQAPAAFPSGWTRSCGPRARWRWS
jgi:hypothetical protein